MLSLDYIVRIYRYEKDKPESIVGTVEEVGIKGKRAFAGLDELWQIVNRSGAVGISNDLRREKAKRH
jgi:hypothetical protein